MSLKEQQTENPSFKKTNLRFQARSSTIEDEPLVLGNYSEPFESGTDINRARFKVWAGIGSEFTFYHEYDLRNSQLLDLRSSWVSNPYFKIRAGQWKPESLWLIQTICLIQKIGNLLWEQIGSSITIATS